MKCDVDVSFYVLDIQSKQKILMNAPVDLLKNAYKAQNTPDLVRAMIRNSMCMTYVNNSILSIESVPT